MKKLFITLCGIAVISSLSNFASAEDKGCPTKFTPEMKAKMEQKRAEMDKRLNLSPEQKEKMKAIHEASKTKIKPLFEKMKVEREKMKQLKDSSASKEEINAQRAKLKLIREQLKAIRTADFEKMQAFLTPAQQAEFNKMHDERKSHMESRKNKSDK